MPTMRKDLCDIRPAQFSDGHSCPTLPLVTEARLSEELESLLYGKCAFPGLTLCPRGLRRIFCLKA